MKPNFKVILFDLGRTILYPMEPWPGIFKLCYANLVEVLLNSGMTGCKPYTPQEIQTCFNNYYDQRTIDQIELSATIVLRDFLTSKGCKDVPFNLLRAALDAMYQITQSNWNLEDDAHTALSELTQSGYHLAILSNAADDLDVQQLIDRWELRKYFDFILTSAEAGRRKPHPLMFQRAMDFFHVDPSEAVMIGDTLAEDISGAENLGIYSIWITRRAQMPPDGELIIQPRAIIPDLKVLPTLLEELRVDA